MAIVKMKRLRLLGMQPDREELFRLLQKLGCVEISEPARDDPERPAMAVPDGSGLARAREENALLHRAQDILAQYAPAKGGLGAMLKPRATVSDGEYFDKTLYENGLDTARAVLDGEKALSALLAEEARLKSRKASLAPWLGLDVPLELESTPSVSLVYGTLPAKADQAAAAAAVAQASDMSALYFAGADQDLAYLLLVCHTSAEPDCLEALRPLGFSRGGLRGWTGTPAENDRRLDEELAALEGKIDRAKEHLASFGPQRETLRRCADRSGQDVAREEAKLRLLDTGSAFWLEGWVPARREDDLAKLLEGFTCAWETETPAEEDYPEVPVDLKNNRFTRCLNMVTNMYALPAYGTVDPNPAMAPFFILFFGIMLADMGYGALMILAGVFMLLKKKPVGGTRDFCELLLYCGISTFVMGAITGGLFGDAPIQLARMFDPDTTWQGLPALFSPLADTTMILIGSMALGLVQIIVGMAISLVQKCKAKQYLDAFFEEVTWWLVFAGIGLMALGVTNIVLYVSIALVVAGPLIQGKGMGKVTGIFGSLYNHVTGFFGDLLSYTRLMALMLAGSVIAQVFNTLGTFTGSIFICIPIMIVGHALNFGLNLLGCYVHDMRLQCLEYFGKFYQDGGRAFAPLKVSSKYYNITENDNTVIKEDM